MPKAFTDCVNSGGKVVTKKLSKTKYMHICYKGNKSYPGEVKTKKSKSYKDLMSRARDVVDELNDLRRDKNG